jgi:glycosyltransferase involved in cell wall biosynthesis
MRGLDCFVLPSLAEGISNTILEAMASGLPVVATRVGGNAEIVEDGVTGRLVSCGDAQALADAIVSYFQAPHLAHQHASAARCASEQRFSLDRMVSDYDKLYLELMDPHARPEAQRRHGKTQLGSEDRP